MSYVSNLSSISTSISGNLQGKLARSVDFCCKIYAELFNSDDLKYQRNFKSVFMPSLYDIHFSEQITNCAFCNKLTASSCHKHCLKCSMGTYIHCSPVLPGILCYEGIAGHSPKAPLPWLYKEPCEHFERLERNKYYKNLMSHTSWVRLYNFEVLEGISNGTLEGRKPCHVCAAVDYEIYKDCLQAGNTCSGSPCYRAADVIGAKIIEAACQ